MSLEQELNVWILEGRSFIVKGFNSTDGIEIPDVVNDLLKYLEERPALFVIRQVMQVMLFSIYDGLNFTISITRNCFPESFDKTIVIIKILSNNDKCLHKNTFTKDSATG